MSLCSFSSIVGGACGPSSENPDSAQFLLLRDCDREVTAHLKLCKISNSENIDNERKLLLARTGEYFADQNITELCSPAMIVSANILTYLTMFRDFCEPRMSAAYDCLP